MRVSIGDKVLYRGKEYNIIHVYASNFCEIREAGTFKTILVHLNDVECLHKDDPIVAFFD
ncbi:MAG TPA: hypothetical protein GX497_15310 [Bacillus bacterium]|nr:hypothetical protein [Bacillus sp. (in: firmicutes)]